MQRTKAKKGDEPDTPLNVVRFKDLSTGLKIVIIYFILSIIWKALVLMSFIIIYASGG